MSSLIWTAAITSPARLWPPTSRKGPSMTVTDAYHVREGARTVGVWAFFFTGLARAATAQVK